MDQNVDSSRLSVKSEVEHPMEELALPARKLTSAEYSKKYRQKVKEEDRELKLHIEQLEERKISAKEENDRLKLHAERVTKEKEEHCQKIELLVEKNKKLKKKYAAIHRVSTE